MLPSYNRWLGSRQNEINTILSMTVNNFVFPTWSLHASETDTLMRNRNHRSLWSEGCSSIGIYWKHNFRQHTSQIIYSSHRSMEEWKRKPDKIFQISRSNSSATPLNLAMATLIIKYMHYWYKWSYHILLVIRLGISLIFWIWIWQALSVLRGANFRLVIAS
jgi:hypothetical protein